MMTDVSGPAWAPPDPDDDDGRGDDVVAAGKKHDDDYDERQDSWHGQVLARGRRDVQAGVCSGGGEGVHGGHVPLIRACGAAAARDCRPGHDINSGMA
ncbi:hypothetical protein [Kitasatospora sp. NPDC001527]|uniref:hypothetical protein n=1 Tax=Kitasatospora sp. NPDC001527 TaxID=3154519 RepID=UPI00332A66CB